MVCWLVASFKAGIVQTTVLLRLSGWNCTECGPLACGVFHGWNFTDYGLLACGVFHDWNCPECSTGLWCLSRLELSRLRSCYVFHGWKCPDYGLVTSFMAGSVQTVVCWLVTPCCAVDGSNHFGVRCCFCLQDRSYLSIFDAQFSCSFWRRPTPFPFPIPQSAYITRPHLRPTHFDPWPLTLQIPNSGLSYSQKQNVIFKLRSLLVRYKSELPLKNSAFRPLSTITHFV